MIGKSFVIAVVLLVAFTAIVDAWVYRDGLPTRNQRGKGKYKNLIVFGDSYSDTGNSLTEASSPPLPYENGRYSNGPVWNEYLADSQNMRLINYAYGGATSDSDTSGGIAPLTGRAIPGMKQQIKKYVNESYLSVKDYSESCTSLWINGNDYVSSPTPNVTAEQVVSNIFASADILYQQGIRCFIIFDMADISKFPAFQNASQIQKTAFPVVFAQHNNGIAQTIPKWKTNHPGVELFHYDYNADVAVVNGPSNPLKIGDFKNGCVPGLAKSGINECEDPDNHFFYDSVHPTTKVHWFVARSLDLVLRGKPQIGKSQPQ